MKLQEQMEAELGRARLMLKRLSEVDGHAPRVISGLWIDGELVGQGLYRGEVGESEDQALAGALGRTSPVWGVPAWQYLGQPVEAFISGRPLTAWVDAAHRGRS